MEYKKSKTGRQRFLLLLAMVLLLGGRSTSQQGGASSPKYADTRKTGDR